MNVFDTREKIVSDYARYIRSFIQISDQEIAKVVNDALDQGKLWPDPLLQFNPAYEIAGKVEELSQAGSIHSALVDVFKGYSLYRHQTDAIRLGTQGRDFVVTSGTGSGKSLTYIGTIFQHLLSNPGTSGVNAVIVYPMNALINSQTNEFKAYKENYERATGKDFPITFGQYTGQEKEEARKGMRESPPQILLTNYMMLELLLTRAAERGIRDAIYENLRYLVFDELHTYRGRQGADIALLIRRIRAKSKREVSCIGTSATMVSSGSVSDQRAEVARVATTIFGRQFSSEQVIQETLARSLDPKGSIPSSQELKAAINTPILTSDGADKLKRHPIAIWLENAIALEERDGHLVRRKPLRAEEVSRELAQASGEPPAVCRLYISGLLQWISAVNHSLREGGSRYTILPFKLHQFISQTGSVYTTLDQGTDRFITLEPGVYKQDESSKKPIFPNVFSRATGHPFICVSRSGGRLEPREFREVTEDEQSDSEDGYLIVGEEVWDPVEDLESLPEGWLKRTKGGVSPEKKKAPFFPQQIYFDEFGTYSETQPMKYSGWFMRAPLLFDPTGGVFFDTKTNEGTKLTQLGSEGRSTSTTIMAFSILNQLHDAKYHIRDQKVLSFTDNRQDAALQSGHFNDFVQVVQLRAGIYKAVKAAGESPLTFATIGEAVFKALSLPFTDFGNREEPPTLPNVRRDYEQTFQAFLFYRVIADLRRSWRIVLPNLEQCGLLSIEYADLADVAKEEAFWADLEILSEVSVSERQDLLTTVLDFFRLEYALYSENFLTPDRLKENERIFREKLRAPWSLDKEENLREPGVLRLDPLHKSARLYSTSMGSASALGKFLKHFAKQKGIDPSFLRGDGYRDFILRLMKKLEDADYLYKQFARGDSNEEVPVFRLRIEKIRWKYGDGTNVKPDVVKRRSYRDQKPKPNEFFRELYKRDFAQFKRLRAEDHTGQLNVETRQDREDRFRADWYKDEAKKQLDDAKIRSKSISALFCSPTMELGIDIGGLSVVHLRNAPPNAANYAQRSGRAGRSGQGALVFTYCSGYSPHDRHYFQHQAELVAGAVQAPKLDLCNRELLETHLNALTISEIGLPGLEGAGGDRPSLMKFVEQDNGTMPLAKGVREGITLSTASFEALKSCFKRVVGDFRADLQQHSAWYTDDWIDRTLSDIAENLDRSLTRWRKLYGSARTLLTRATQPIEGGRLQVGSDEYRKYKRLQDQANRQLNLLRNDVGGSSELSEFYPYRYLASEGFLPGYNFTRLPLRVFVPTGTTGGEYISRPRTVALREFGPLNIIYHSGRKYKVAQLVIQDAESALTEAKVSTKAGFLLTEHQKDLEICPFSGVGLSDNANKEHIHDLMEMSESRAEEVDRISCEEEERISRGFNVQTFFSIDDGDFEKVKKATAKTTETDLLRLRFIPAARLVHINSGWRSQTVEGFPMGLTSGDWRASMPDPQDPNLRETFRIVKLKTSNLADALYIEPIQALGLEFEGVVTLEHALKRAIEKVFQVEPNEIGVVAVGDHEAPNILLYEAAEGSLGILSQFVEDTSTFHEVIETAKQICRYDDLKYLGPASYDDLLSYYNQRDHKIIDRFLIRDALEKLSLATIELQTNTGFRDYEEHYQAMLRGLDPNSSTERAFIKHLYENGLRLPDAAQKRVPGIYCQPDFYYEPRIWVFCDGSPHDTPEIREKDEEQRQLIMARGDEVWVWHYREDLAQKIAARPDIFKKVR